MSGMDGRKLGNLQLVRGGLYGTPRLSNETRLERGVRQRFAAMMTAAKDKSIYNVAEDVTHPTRVLARLLRKAHDRRVPHEQAKEVVREIDRYVDRLYGRAAETGEYRPAA